MSDKTGIEWTDATWNPVTGCTKVSPGCDHCYAETLAERFRGTPGHYFEQGFDVQLRPDKLDLPLRWRKPKRVFVNSMSDLFHDDVPADYIARVWAVMALTPQHTYQVLTKRHSRMRSLLRDQTAFETVVRAEINHRLDSGTPYPAAWDPQAHDLEWPLPNVWLGVSVENQQWANIRIPALLDTPAAVRFLSCEPLLGPVDLTQHTHDCHAYFSHTSDQTCICGGNLDGLHWVIVGGESGRGARPMHPDWARSLRDQCTAAGVPFLFKQWGAHVTVGQMTEVGSSGWELRNGLGWPEETLVRMHKGAAGRELDGRTWDEFPAGVA
ncbi:MAG TPA: phage Gp37/Gp68 family protein [Aeromicrobium sp.]|nr:phage Gp37/Gp68 family protein [Aeromicrobium sp.]HKY58344.1 phage Gp37/Gp68 family protein [Aeromicrobium sp.]